MDLFLLTKERNLVAAKIFVVAKMSAYFCENAHFLFNFCVNAKYVDIISAKNFAKILSHFRKDFQNCRLFSQAIFAKM
jgi:hypothetical protein